MRRRRRGPARLDVSRTAAGYAVRLRFVGARSTGRACAAWSDADVAVEVDAREVDQPRTADEELRSPYIDRRRARPRRAGPTTRSRSRCRSSSCAAPTAQGLCPVCGASLNDADPAEHDHEPEPDPRWAKLRELKLDQ